MDRKLWHLLNGFGFGFSSAFFFFPFFIRLGLFHFTTASRKGRLLSCIILAVPRPPPPLPRQLRDWAAYRAGL